MKTIHLTVLTAGLSLLTLKSEAQPLFLTNGLMAYFPFNGNGNDKSGNGNNLALTTQTFIPNWLGQASNAIHFNYGNSITIPNSTGWNYSNFTVSVWAELDSSALVYGYWPFVVGKRVNDNDGLWNIGLTSANPSANSIGTWGFGLWPTNGTFGINSTSQVNTNQWAHLCITADGSNFNCYVNGVLQAQTNYTGGLTVSGNPITIGGNGWSGGAPQTWQGGIGSFRYYNLALSSSEVTQLYAIESGQTLSVVKAVTVQDYNLNVGSNYLLQVSSDLAHWTNYGVAFTATNTYWQSTNYWNVANWNQLFFRLSPQ